MHSKERTLYTLSIQGSFLSVHDALASTASLQKHTPISRALRP